MRNLSKRVAELEAGDGAQAARGMTVVAWDGRGLEDVLAEHGVVERVSDTIVRINKPEPCASAIHFWGVKS